MTLIDRLYKLDGADNRIDVLVELALFKPDANYKSIRANTAGTKVIFTRTGGKRQTCWADEHTLTPESRAECIALLREKEARKL